MPRNDHSHIHQPDTPAVALTIDPAALRPLIAEVVEQTLARLEAVRGALPDRLAFSEPEAARLLGLNTHQVRDERLRGRIQASKIVGGRIAYLREDLQRYLADRRK